MTGDLKWYRETLTADLKWRLDYELDQMGVRSDAYHDHLIERIAALLKQPIKLISALLDQRDRLQARVHQLEGRTGALMVERDQVVNRIYSAVHSCPDEATGQLVAERAGVLWRHEDWEPTP